MLSVQRNETCVQVVGVLEGAAPNQNDGRMVLRTSRFFTLFSLTAHSEPDNTLDGEKHVVQTIARSCDPICCLRCGFDSDELDIKHNLVCFLKKQERSTGEAECPVET